MKREGALALAALLGAGAGLAGAWAHRRRRAGDTQARRLARRAMAEEAAVRRQVAEALHDGPVQELIALDMVLASAAAALEGGDGERGAQLLAEARELTARNVRLLREELIELGSHSFAEGDLETALQRCRPVWQRRYGLDVQLSLERLELDPELAGQLFRIIQESVVNAGRHAQARVAWVDLHAVGGRLELRIGDDGRGLDSDPLNDPEAGHLGLASVRERAELLGGSLELDSSERGTEVLVRVPQPS